MKKLKLTITTITLVNAFEMYNFLLYGILSSALAEVFFPHENVMISNIDTLTAFSVGMITRPLGAILFGYIGDKCGRKDALLIAIFLSALSMLLIGLMPSYRMVGVISPVLVILLRLSQGLAFGGIYNGAAIFTLEHLSRIKSMRFPGMIGGIIASSSALGALSATLMGASIASFLPQKLWLWRVPFVLGSLLGIIGLYIYKNIPETPEFQEKNKFSHSLSLIQILIKYPKSCLAIFFSAGLNVTFPAFSVGFLNFYVSYYLNIPLEQAALFYMYGAFICLIFCPMFGFLSDYFDRRGYFAMAVLGVIATTPFIFDLLQQKTQFSIITAYLLIGVVHASLVGAQHTFFQTLFPVEVRYTGISVSYGLGAAVFGGIPPMICTLLIERTNNLDIPVFFICTCAIFCLISIIALGDTTYGPKNKFDEFRKII